MNKLGNFLDVQGGGGFTRWGRRTITDPTPALLVISTFYDAAGYLTRKYEGMNNAEAEEIMQTVTHCQLGAKVQYICGPSVHTFTAFYEVLRGSRINHSLRASCYFACEMDCEQEEALDIYYRRLLELILSQVDVDSAL